MSLYKFLALQIHCVCSTLKGRGSYVKRSLPRCSSVEYTWTVCRERAGDNFSVDVFLRIIYKDNESTFEDLLKNDNSVYNLHKNIQLLGTELYKVKNNLSTHLMSEIFNLINIDYNLHSQIDFNQGPVNTVNSCLKSLSYLAHRNMACNSS